MIQLIETNQRSRGDGTCENPTRIVTQYWTMEGKLMFERDPLARHLSHDAIRSMKGQLCISLNEASWTVVKNILDEYLKAE